MRLSVLTLALMPVLAMPAYAQEATAYLVVSDSPLAGFRYNEGKLVWNEMRAGDALGLVREHDNRFDDQAIRLEWNGRKIGYVPRDQNRALAVELDAGRILEARIIKLGKHRNGRYLVSYDVLIPLQAPAQAHKENK